MTHSRPLQFIIIENDTTRARLYEDLGIERVMVDLETVGKAERQGHLDTVRSNHTIADIGAVRRVLSRSELMVRINPWGEYSAGEIDAAVREGAQRIMLPMFRSPEEVRSFITATAGRTKTTLLLETPQALVRIRELVDISGIDEIFVGLNDLSLGLGLDFLFEPLAGGLVDHAAQQTLAKGISFGFGGVGTADTGEVPGRCVVREHARIGSSAVILSRTFKALAADQVALRTELEKLRAEYATAQNASDQLKNQWMEEARRLIFSVAEQRRTRLKEAK